MSDCSHTPDAAGWVLGALDATEAEAFAAHLWTCAECGAAVAGLAPTAGLLALATEQVEPPAALRDSIMSVVDAEARLLRAAGPDADRPARARRRRWWSAGLSPALAGGLACLLIAIGIGAGVAINDNGEDPAQTFARTMPSGVGARATVVDGRVTLDLRRLPAASRGRVYQVWLERDGKAVPTESLFTPPTGGRATIAVQEPLQGADRVMVSEEPPGGSPAPTSTPAVDVAIS